MEKGEELWKWGKRGGIEFEDGGREDENRKKEHKKQKDQYEEGKWQKKIEGYSKKHMLMEKRG